MRWAFVVAFALSILSIAVEQIIGGAGQAKFEPGDVTLFADDFSAIPIGETSPNFKLMRGTYEVAQFQGKKWLRPLDKGLGLTKLLRLPDEFSFEFSLYAFKAGGPYVRVYLHSSRGLAEWGGEGGERFVQVEVGHEHGKDYAELRCSDKATGYPKEVARQELPPDQIHRVAIQVRRKQLRLFVDEKRIAVIPFQPESPIEGFGFYWYYHYQSDTPYCDAPVLLTDIRIATYSGREALVGRGGTAQLLLILDKTKLDKEHPLREALKKFGAVEFNDGWWLPLPAEPFGEPGTWHVKLEAKTVEQWAKTVKDFLAQAKQLHSEAHLRVECFAPEIGETKKQEKFWEKQVGYWLAALRARELKLWLIQAGLSAEEIKTVP